jgi:uncharacterized membrane protein YgdD (TMEM256/DUF423 family)
MIPDMPNEINKYNTYLMSKIDKKIVVVASFLGAFTIALGAFVAHGLKDLIDEDSLITFNTGIRYQMFHILALLIMGFSSKIPKTAKNWVFGFMIFGILMFSGSLYVLSLKDLLDIDASSIGFITPLGGILFILAWLRLAYGIILNK